MKPIYLFADSQLLFWRDENGLFLDSVRDLIERPQPKAAYIGASNGDDPAFYSLFQGAMDGIGICDCCMIHSQLADDEASFLEEADLILLAGGDVQQGWEVFKTNDLRDTMNQVVEDATAKLDETREWLHEFQDQHEHALSEQAEAWSTGSQELADALKQALENDLDQRIAPAAESVEGLFQALASEMKEASAETEKQTGRLGELLDALQQAMDPLPGAVEAVKDAAQKVGIDWPR